MCFQAYRTNGDDLRQFLQMGEEPLEIGGRGGIVQPCRRSYHHRRGIAGSAREALLEQIDQPLRFGARDAEVVCVATGKGDGHQRQQRDCNAQRADDAPGMAGGEPRPTVEEERAPSAVH